MASSLTAEFKSVKKFLEKSLLSKAGIQSVWKKAMELNTEEEQRRYFRGVIRWYRTARGFPVEAEVPEYKKTPVGVEEFLKDKFYLGLRDEIYPEVLPYVIEINSGKYVEAVLTGGIGCAKTTIALWSNAYQLYLLSLMENPHGVFGLDRSSEIELIFQNITATLAKGVDFERFRSLVQRSSYFRQYFPFDRKIDSELRFPNRIIVKPVSGSNLATIGQNVIGGLIDELNYMAVIEKSKRSVDATLYNQAVEVYNSIARRRKTRFMQQGKLPGILCLVSSKRYPGQFTDQKMEEAKSDPTIFVYDKRVWEIKPWAFSPKRFRVFIGDDFQKPRILGAKEKPPTKNKDAVIEVPEDLRLDFDKDIVNALRELGGVSHLTKSPFIMKQDLLVKAFKNRPSILSRDSCDFVESLLEVFKDRFYKPEIPRWAHVDLGLTKDSAGIAIGAAVEFVKMNRGNYTEQLPLIRMDATLEVRPPREGEILFWKIRKLFHVLRQLGLNIKWVSFDTFQSIDSMQVLRQQGFVTGPQSMDKTTVPYDFFKSAIYDGRMDAPFHDRALRECRELQLDSKEGKIDHLPNGSKDIADAMAGVVYGLTMRREVWVYHSADFSKFQATLTMATRQETEEPQEDTPMGRRKQAKYSKEQGARA